ncbi:prolipoprotein diacylglyceryl transferase [Novosphingobium sp. G106]|uniref:prolipoprotein diacylglyceryl transferase n=1 Tax=Novosphingobium sp. G106 TaxID=2849500 RepID=UPI001C2DDED4|nr:prolipoprotein diacylglyceryl transferase [Novosphingobium sp. G106]MBV1692586.1 prolipoprotein diacylglyceryl transferase [Novosphingobium sp. G106]
MSLAASAYTAIQFSSLHLSPVFLQIGPFALRWYSLSYLAGIMLGWSYLVRLLAEPGAPMSRDDADNLIVWLTLGIIAGGRIAYVLFYDLQAYISHPLNIFKLWQGGMSFHGGAFGVALAILLYARRNKLNWLRIIDYVAMCAPIGLFLGRLANFVNGELWGRPTSLPWGIVFPGAGPLPRHPSQIYEAGLEGPLLFALLWCLFRFTGARYRPGTLSGSFILGYGAFRFLVEFVREPDSQLAEFASRTGLHMGQWLCVPMIIVGVALIVRASHQKVEYPSANRG